jgi:transcriptional regulator with XRE-family HTH domain
MISPAQCRAARSLLDWRQPDLAEAAQVSEVTIRQFEGGRTKPQRATLGAIQAALEAAGVEFTNGDEPGVKLVRRSLQ